MPYTMKNQLLIAKKKCLSKWNFIETLLIFINLFDIDKLIFDIFDNNIDNLFRY